jgi:hypothetical protein
MRLRELRFEDYAAVRATLDRNGLRQPTRDQWEYFWNGPPRGDLLQGIPFGWILEHERDGVVGTFRNIPFVYEWNCRPIRVVVASAWAVDEPHRHHSLMLARAYFNQSGVDVLLNTTAVLETSGKAFLAFRAARVPQAAYTTRMLWITGYRGFAENVLRERGVPGAALLRHPAGAVAWAGDLPRRSDRDARRVRQVTAFDERFDRFWTALRQRRDRLQALRDAKTLAWRFALERRRPLIVVLEKGVELDGYAVLVRRDAGAFRRVEVADIQARDDDPEIVRTLMDGALGIARDEDVHLVALSGQSDAKRRGLHRLKPHIKTVPGWPLYYKAVDAALVEPLTASAAWDMSLYDGDALWSAMFDESSAA